MKPLLSLRSLLTLLSLTLATHAGASPLLNVDFKIAGLKDPKGVKWLTNSPGLLS